MLSVARRRLYRPHLVVPGAGWTNSGNLGSDIRTYCRLAGDNAYTVPNGTYGAGSLTDAAHAVTGGQFKGYLLLRPQTPGAGIIDLSQASGGDFILDGATSGIIFVGFKYQNGHVQHNVSDVHYWYTSHTFPYQVWGAEPGRQSNTSYHNDNTTLFFGNGCVSCMGLGVDIDQAGSGLTLQGGCRLLDWRGFHITNIDDGGASVDVVDNVHPDAICMLNGNVWHHSFSDGDIDGTLGRSTGIQFQNLSGNWNGGTGTWTADDCEDLNFARIWSHDHYLGGLTIESFHKQSGANCLVAGTLADVHVWNNGRIAGGQNNVTWQYVQSVDNSQGITYTVGNNPQPSRLNFPATNSDSLVDASLGGTVDSPAVVWRNTPGHAYDDVLTFFTNLGWPR